MATIAITETYEDVKLLIFKVAGQFTTKYGGDFNDWVSEGNQIFMRAYRTYKPESGRFTTWLVFLLNKLMMEKVRRASMRNARVHQVHLFLQEIPNRVQCEFDVSEFKASLSEDAQAVVELVLEWKTDLRLALLEKGYETPFDEKQPRAKQAMVAARKCVRELLVDLGWDSSRISSTFSEIKSCL